ncbi:MAG: aa3-type cytochrome c oxidase subunit IV [Devosia sp.]
MADHTVEERHPDMDYAQHEATWNTFINLAKWGIGIIVVLLVFLYIVINP